MRYSTDEDDEGYSNWMEVRTHGKFLKAYLDGAEVKSAFTVDVEKGYILKAIEPPHVKEGTEYIATEELYGKVTVEII